jgi:hypothetical protein
LAPKLNTQKPLYTLREEYGGLLRGPTDCVSH